MKMHLTRNFSNGGKDDGFKGVKEVVYWSEAGNISIHIGEVKA